MLLMADQLQIATMALLIHVCPSSSVHTQECTATYLCTYVLKYVHTYVRVHKTYVRMSYV